MLKFVANISKVSRLGFGLPCYQTLSEILADIKSGSRLSKCESLTHRCIAVYLQESIVDIQGRVEKVETQIESCTQKDAELHAIQVRRKVLVHDLSSRASVPNRFSSIKLFCKRYFRKRSSLCRPQSSVFPYKSRTPADVRTTPRDWLR